MSESIEALFLKVKAHSQAHDKIKAIYNKQHAVGFNVFQFFKVGENKLSELLAFFFDEKQNHGQGNLFLEAFVQQFCDDIKLSIDTSNSLNICEKRITNGKRIDIYIELKEFTIAIENKIWADDQSDQLQDYSKYLERKTNGKYLLLYLNPYGLEPSKKSICTRYKEELLDTKKLKIISYNADIIELLNTWLTICQAKVVTSFIKELKTYIETEILGKHRLNMSTEEVRTLIYDNINESKEIVQTYKAIEKEILTKLDDVRNKLKDIDHNINKDIKVIKTGVFSYQPNLKIYKQSFTKGSNTIWIQLVKDELDLFINYYLEDETDTVFEDYLPQDLKIESRMLIDRNLNATEIATIFKEKVQCVDKSFAMFEKQEASK